MRALLLIAIGALLVLLGAPEARADDEELVDTDGDGTNDGDERRTGTGCKGSSSTSSRKRPSSRRLSTFSVAA